MQAASGSSSERVRGSPSAMETGGDQSAKKQRLELVLASLAPVKQEMVVVVHDAGEMVPAVQAPTKEVHLDLTVLDCHFCFRPLKPPVHQCNGGHLACGDCRGERPGNERQCEKCEHGGGFDVHNTAMDAVVSAARVGCAHTCCGLFITYHKLQDHQDACRFAPCKCPVPGCGFECMPRTLPRHLTAVHPMPVQTIHYGKVLQLQVPVLEPRRLLFAEEDNHVFLVVGGALGPSAPIAVSVVCIRAGASPPPHYTAKVWVNGPPSAVNGRVNTVRAEIEVTSTKEPDVLAVEELMTFLAVPPKMLAWDGPSRSRMVSLRIRIDKTSS
ncbi:putative E3 ubiquitin-protein ligase SINA-like 6 isoform X2 [Aegilops tauschii subsp. strangulata]|uniref:putative E3 ubiquitin-protein ligase SINA-like 6 isoform X2 n=1 Tax=Aegilops tauschii subsp. strangulata TaxID=200361 RepID=UPI00098A0FA7|nr:putative E3 ubiquitin-protein ligase SINA-like 6 [Aegilops tauschii subsp. strangulata]